MLSECVVKEVLTFMLAHTNVDFALKPNLSQVTAPVNDLSARLVEAIMPTIQTFKA